MPERATCYLSQVAAERLIALLADLESQLVLHDHDNRHVTPRSVHARLSAAIEYLRQRVEPSPFGS